MAKLKELMAKKYLKLPNSHPDAYRYKRRQDVCESLVNLRENVGVKRFIGSQFKEADDESISLNVHLNEEVRCDIDDGDSGKEIHIDEWTGAYISEINGLKMKISRKRKHEEVQDGSDDKTNGTSPLNTPLSKNINGTSPLNTPLSLPKKVDGLSPLNTPLSKNINGTSPLNIPLPNKIKHNVI